MAKMARHSGLGVSMAMTPSRASRLAHRRISSGSRSGGRCSTTCAQKMPSSDPFRQAGQVREQVGGFRVQTLVAAQGHGFLAEIDAARGDAGLAHQFQKLAAAAADIQHVLAALEIRHDRTAALP